MDWFWHTLLICLVVIPMTLLWAGAIFDIIWRRRDIRRWHRLLWLVAVLVFPLIGALVYVSVGFGRGESAADYLDDLHRHGVLDDGDYDQQRERLHSQTRVSPL